MANTNKNLKLAIHKNDSESVKLNQNQTNIHETNNLNQNDLNQNFSSKKAVISLENNGKNRPIGDQELNQIEPKKNFVKQEINSVNKFEHQSSTSTKPMDLVAQKL